MSASNRWATGLTVVAVALGLWLRWGGLGSKSLWFDEGYTAWVVSLPPRELVDAVRLDTAPPLYYLLMHGWTQAAGRSEAALRLPSAVCATLALFVMVAIVRRLFRDPWARAAAVSLIACSFMQVAYAHEARFYAAVGLLGAVDLYLAIRACDVERPAIGWLAASAVAWAASLWLNNIMAIYLACLALAWLALPGRRTTAGRVRDVAAVAAVAALAFAPWVPALLAQRRAVAVNYWSHAPALSQLPPMFPVVAGLNLGGDESAGVAVFACAAVVVLIATVAGRRWRLGGALAVFGLLPIGLTFVYSRHATSIFLDRAFIVSSLVVPLLGAVPLEVARRPDRRAGAAVLVLVLLPWSFASAWANRYRTPDHAEDWRGACRYAAELRTPRTLTVFNANEGEMLYDYYARGGDYAPRPDLTGTPADYFDSRPAHTLQRVRTDADLDRLRTLIDPAPEQVVLVSAHWMHADADRRTLSLLRHRMRQVEERPFDGVTVYRFAR